MRRSYFGKVAAMPAAQTVPTLRKALKSKSPSLLVERELWDAGHEVVVGMDEVGRGAWAGPLSVGAAVIPQRQARLQDPRLEDAHARPSARRCSIASRRGA